MATQPEDMAQGRPPRNLRDVGGTTGGLAEFLIGLALLIAGGYLFLDNVIVTGSFWSFFGFSAFGLTLIPIFIGIAFLFFNGKSLVGWLLTFGGAIVIFVGVLAQMHIFFRPTSLFNTLLMLTLIAGGVGLIAKALRPHKPRE
jgi:hypothetical protein